MPRVLLTGFCAVPGPRRSGVQMRHVIRSLTPMHSVDLLVVREGDQAYVERQGSVRVLRVPTHESDPRLQIQAFQRALKRQLDGADYDIVHCRDSWSGVTVLEARARLGYTVVYDLSRSPLGEATSEPELDAQYARDEAACLAAADLVLAPTPSAVKALATKDKPDRVLLSPPGVDIDRFDWETPPTGGPPRILYAGTIDPGRGLRVLVRAFAAVVRETDARLVIAGAMVAKFDQPLRDSIRELGLTDKIEIVGPVDHDQMPALIASATVCVVPAAADLTPSPNVVFPTKILEYMACRRAVVAPRRQTLAHVVENNREALLFEAGDPIDLARKVLRLIGEPLLRERIAQNAYERVRRDFTASAARRAIRSAYNLLAERFGVALIEASADESPKVELLADDDFEATVFEDAPVAPAVDTALNKMQPLEDALQSLGESETGGSTSSESAIAPPAPRDPHEPDETMERPPVAARPEAGWTISDLAAPTPPASHDDWIVTNVAGAVRSLSAEQEVDDEEVEMEMLIEEGTPAEGMSTVPPPHVENSFVAGEIDVPAQPSRGQRDHDTPSVEFQQPDPDTGSRTPPIARR